MRSKKPIVLIVLALGCGLAASIGISQVMSHQDTGPVEETAPVWVAMADIKPNDPLTPQNLKLEQWPKEKIPPGALSKLEEIDGKRTKTALYQGEAVLDKKLAGHDPGVGQLVPKGFRLFTVQADGMSSHGGLLHPGDRVDLVLYIAKGIGNLDSGTKTILQDIRVFAVNDIVRPTDDKAEESIIAKTVTLLVTPTQAEKAALASEIGKIRLVMRGPGDDELVDPAGQTAAGLLNIEKTDRQVENMNKLPPPVNMAMATHMAEKAVAAPIAAAPVEDVNFTMQVIKGTEIGRSEFKRKWDDASRWENGSYSVVSQDAPPPEAPAPTPTPAPAINQAPPRINAKLPGLVPAKPKDDGLSPGRG